jgi:hypothetical protein
MASGSSVTADGMTTMTQVVAGDIIDVPVLMPQVQEALYMLTTQQAVSKDFRMMYRHCVYF